MKGGRGRVKGGRVEGGRVERGNEGDEGKGGGWWKGHATVGTHGAWPLSPVIHAPWRYWKAQSSQSGDTVLELHVPGLTAFSAGAP